MTEALVDGPNQVILNGITLKTRGPVADTNLSVFGGKVVTGDYTKDSNPTLSAWVLSDLSGGHGIDDMNEGVDVNRYKIGTLYTRYPAQISKGHKVNAVATDASWGEFERYFLGDLKVGSTWKGFIAIYSTVPNISIRRIDDPGVSIGVIPFWPSGPSVVFQGTAADTWLLTPHNSGFCRVSNNAYAFVDQTGDATHPAARAFVVWDNKLIAIDNVGQLWYCTDPTGAWVSYGATAKLPQGDVPRALVRYFDRQGQPAVFCVSDRAIWQLDPNTPEIFSVDVEFPTHIHHGMAACRWSGDLYFSVGMGVHRYTGGSLSAVGLDRDAGLPAEYSSSLNNQGSTVSGLVPGYNGMFALVSGPGDATATLDGQATALYSSLHEFTGSGWHMLWQKQDSAVLQRAVPNSMCISQHDGNYRLYWGYGGAAGTSVLYYIDLPRNFASPRQRARQSTGYFESSSSTAQFLETGIFDAGMQGYNKLASAYDVTIGAIDSGATLTVKYRTSNFTSGQASSWTTLGTVTTTGTTSLPFGTFTNGIYPGIVFERIQFRFDLTDTTNNAFIMESGVLSFVKITPSAYTWNFDVDLTTSSGGDSPQLIIDQLNDILEAGVMVPFVLRNVTYRVFVSQISGSVNTGANESAYRRITLLQIPQSLGAG